MHDSSSSHGDGRRRRFRQVRRSGSKFTVTSALLAGDATGTLVGLAVAVTSLKSHALSLVVLLGLQRTGSTPRRQNPLDTGEALKLKRLALPATARGPGAI